MFMLMLIYYEKKILFYRWKVGLKIWFIWFSSIPRWSGVALARTSRFNEFNPRAYGWRGTDIRHQLIKQSTSQQEVLCAVNVTRPLLKLILLLRRSVPALQVRLLVITKSWRHLDKNQLVAAPPIWLLVPSFLYPMRFLATSTPLALVVSSQERETYTYNCFFPPK